MYVCNEYYCNESQYWPARCTRAWAWITRRSIFLAIWQFQPRSIFFFEKLCGSGWPVNGSGLTCLCEAAVRTERRASRVTGAILETPLFGCAHESANVNVKPSASYA